MPHIILNSLKVLLLLLTYSLPEPEHIVASILDRTVLPHLQVNLIIGYNFWRMCLVISSFGFINAMSYKIKLNKLKASYLQRFVALFDHNSNSDVRFKFTGAQPCCIYVIYTFDWPMTAMKIQIVAEYNVILKNMWNI